MLYWWVGITGYRCQGVDPVYQLAIIEGLLCQLYYNSYLNNLVLFKSLVYAWVNLIDELVLCLLAYRCQGVDTVYQLAIIEGLLCQLYYNSYLNNLVLFKSLV